MSGRTHSADRTFLGRAFLFARALRALTVTEAFAGALRFKAVGASLVAVRLAHTLASVGPVAVVDADFC